VVYDELQQLREEAWDKHGILQKLLCAQTLLLVWVERVLQRCADSI
jgi:hypothetical protein